MGLSASTLFLMSTAATTIGTISSVRAQRAAIARENYRLETERRLAEVQALEEENARTEVGLQELANNLAYQSTAGYLDNSMSFININKQVKKNKKKIKLNPADRCTLILTNVASTKKIAIATVNSILHFI